MKAVMYNYHTWIPYQKEEKLVKDFEKMLKQSGFTIVNKVEHFFERQGYTGLWLLAESHFAIHTFPENNKIYVEISSCVKEYFNKFLEMLKESEYEID
ncbi:MAG: spermidine synthase [Clostridia bacterium]|nr:spermidine synthase [Clostridia bacterium]